MIPNAALAVRDLLAELGFVSFVKTTGGKGLHVVVPIRRNRTWDEVLPFSRWIASLLADASPKEYTLTLSRSKRTSLILVDYLRNGRGATAVEAYSARAREGAPVATPVHWDEVDAKLRPASFTVKTVPRRLASLEADPWAGFATVRQSITSALLIRAGLAPAVRTGSRGPARATRQGASRKRSSRTYPGRRRDRTKR